jgi:hypothetical protein
VTSASVPPGDPSRAAPDTDPAVCGVGEPAASALPVRIRGVPLLVRRAQPQSDPEILRRVLDGLNQL